MAPSQNMDFTQAFRRRIIGLLWLVTCVALLGWGVQQVSRSTGAIQRQLSIVLLDEGPQGLQAGADVVLGGVVIGKVTETTTSAAPRVRDATSHSNRIVLTAEVLDKQGMLDAFAHADSFAVVRRKLSGFGGSYIEITGGRYGTLADVNDHIPGFSEDDPNQQAQALLPQAQAAVQNLADAAAQIKITLATATTGKGLAGRLLTDESLGNDVATSAAEIKSQQHAIGQQIQTLLTQTTETGKKLDALIEQLRTGNGLAGRLVSDERLAQSVRAAIEQVQITLQSVQAAVGDVRNSGLIRFGNPGSPASAAPGPRERAAQGKE